MPKWDHRVLCFFKLNFSEWTLFVLIPWTCRRIPEQTVRQTNRNLAEFKWKEINKGKVLCTTRQWICKVQPQRKQTQLNSVSPGAGEERQLWPMNESAIFPGYVGLAIWRLKQATGNMRLSQSKTRNSRIEDKINCCFSYGIESLNSGQCPPYLAWMHQFYTG